RFASIHVVGSNGKTSVARMTTALLDAHGATAGAYLSPHIESWRERIVIGGESISEQAFARALERAEQAAEVADRSASDEEGPVTQFELLTAAAFLALAAAKIKVGVIEAGLGGRLDATNVIPSRATVLTSVGLEHTDWLGDTTEKIAAEKLAVLRDHTTLVCGEVPAEVRPLVEAEAARRHARLLRPRPVSRTQAPGLPGYQRRNMGLALSAAEVVLGDLRSEAVRAAIDTLSSSGLAGRAETIPGSPIVILDAAHNADGARALAATLPELSERGRAVCCFALLEGKDAAAMAAALAPVCDAVVCTEVAEEAIAAGGRPGGRAQPAASLAALFDAEGVVAEAVPDPAAALTRAMERAREAQLPVLVTGSHFLISSARRALAQA
ncbi:MAG: Mur ligase family protein, partial [Actinomycetota bacterium]|nr:Mur ligase family protein [Actinomycetota bacterium]